MKIRLYTSLFQQYEKEFLIYRVKVILMTVSQFISPLVMMLVLSNLPGKRTSSMSSDEIINYYLFTSLLYLFMSSKIDGFVKTSILEGGLAVSLLRPVNFWLVALTKDLASRFIKLLVGFPIILILFTVYFNKINLSQDNSLLYLVISVLLGYLLSFFLSFATGLLAFFIEEIWGLQNLKEILVLLLGGVALPYKFFPENMQHLLSYTPFPYLVNWPLRIGFSGNVLFEIYIAIIWLCFLVWLCSVMWKKGIRKYSGMGAY